MTTDLKNMTVEELRAIQSRWSVQLQAGSADELKRHRMMRLAAFDELARRLEEAQREIEADDRNVNNLMDQVHELSQKLEEAQQAPPPVGWVRIVEGHSGLVAAEVAWQVEKPTGIGLWRALYMDDHSATHDAKVAAKAKTEALEEGAEICDRMLLYTGWDCAASLRALAIEYRVKAGRKE